jgi:hypothetical protein
VKAFQIFADGPAEIMGENFLNVFANNLDIWPRFRVKRAAPHPYTQTPPGMKNEKTN